MYKIVPTLECTHATTVLARSIPLFLFKYFQCKVNISAIMTILYKYFQCKASISMIVMYHCKYFLFKPNIYLVLVFYGNYLQECNIGRILDPNISIIGLLVGLKWAFLYNIPLINCFKFYCF